MEISVDSIKDLREQTSCGVIECKKALEEAKGDFAKAKEILQKRGLEIAAKKVGRVAKEGRIETYIHHGNKMGVLLELNCETDFVAKNDAFCQLAKDLAMHVAACNPKYIRREDIPEAVLKEQFSADQFVKENCLLNQAFVKDASKSIQDYLNSVISSTGENIVIGRYSRFKVGESE